MQKNVLKKSFASHKWDLILGAALLLAALCLFIVFGKTKKPGAYVIVKQHNKITGKYSLEKDAEIEIKNIYGSNTLVISDGGAFLKDSTCRDKTCEHMGRISAQGEMIICLPHELFITVASEEKGGYDAVSE